MVVVVVVVVVVVELAVRYQAPCTRMYRPEYVSTMYKQTPWIRQGGGARGADGCTTAAQIYRGKREDRKPAKKR